MIDFTSCNSCAVNGDTNQCRDSRLYTSAGSSRSKIWIALQRLAVKRVCTIVCIRGQTTLCLVKLILGSKEKIVSFRIRVRTAARTCDSLAKDSLSRRPRFALRPRSQPPGRP